MEPRTISFVPDPYDEPAIPGQHTNPAGQGDAGDDGQYNYNSGNCKYDCKTSPTNGKQGKEGATGQKGNDGAKGRPGPICPFTLTDVEGDLLISAGGGTGQTGGLGGNGGDGGAGGAAGRLNPNNYSIGTACTEAKTGPQGIGGKGGPGGTAGDGGNGAQVIIMYTSISGNITTRIVASDPGKPGGGGPAGKGSSDRGPGDNGATGKPGSASTITLVPQ